MRLLTLLLILGQGIFVPADSGSVSGTVTNAAGMPLAGVRVTAAPAVTAATAKVAEAGKLVSLAETDSQGRYVLENVPPGRYYISAGRIDFPTYYPATLDVIAATVIDVRARQKVEGVHIRLQDSSAGRAVATRVPASSYQIPLHISMEGGGKAPVVVGNYYPYLRLVPVGGSQGMDLLFNQGVVALPLPSPSTPDQYRVDVHDLPPGYSVRSLTLGVGADARDLTREPLRISVNAAVTSSGSSITAPQPIVLVLARPTGNSVSGRRVTGTSTFQLGEVYLSGTPGTLFADGSFEFEGVPPGRHAIARFTESIANPQGAVVVVTDKDVSGVKLRVYDLMPEDLERDAPRPAGNLPPGQLEFPSLRGRVIDADSGQAIIEGGAILLRGYRYSNRAYALDSNGEFRVNNLLPGSYRIEVRLTGYQPYVGSVRIDEGAADVTFRVQRMK